VTLVPSARLGPYELVALLGAGGMGEVYRARDTRLGRDVAIKVLPAQFASEPDRLRRFEQEARAIAALSHPNILALYDVGTHEGSPFIVSELLEGETLRERLKSGGLTVRKAVETSVQIAQGLAAAHEKGIVHRDLKPANVFVTKDGHVKILDFGIAKLTRPDPGPQGTTLTPEPSTETGALMGTVGYMSPEQVRGLPADHRTDIFSFGCVLYEMLSGRSPFRKDTAAETMTAILHEDPPALAGIGREIPQALEGIVTRCLEKRPDDRFSSAHDLALALGAHSGATETPAKVKAPVRLLRVWRSWVVGAVGVVVVAVAAALLVWGPWRKAAPAASFDPGSVVVTVFENRTGDRSLDSVGQQIADALTNDLLKTGELKVAANPVASSRTGETGGDPLLRLARATRSAVVVAGTYDLRGDHLEVQARVVEPWHSKVVYAATPVQCPRVDPLPALEPLRQRVTGAVAWNFDRKLRAFFSGFRPPRYDALLEFRLGRAAESDLDSARAHFEKAVALDPEFDLARLEHMKTTPGNEDYAKELAAVEANLGRMMPAERAMVRYYRADLEGRRLDALAALRERATLSGSPENFQFDLGVAEVALNRPAEAIRALSSLPLDWDVLERHEDYWPELMLAVAYHLNRDYENELNVAREGQHRFPGVVNFYSHETWALAALGRLDEIEKAIEACQAQQGGLRRTNIGGTPGGIMFSTALELRAHGHPEASAKMAERAVAWYRSRPAAEAEKPDMQYSLMCVLLLAGRATEAKVIADAQLAKDPNDIGARQRVGTLAARLGDTVAARRIEAELPAVTQPYAYDALAYLRARIAAQLGEKNRAVALLRDAFAHGLGFTIDMHRDFDLEPLWGYPPFEELMKPKG
jgi:TolB-like protein/tetratricopeptide (TPR) repeat protein